MEIKELIGKTLNNIEYGEKNKKIFFTTDKNEKYCFYHEQDCCECVTIEDICGNLNDLIGTPILQAEENCSRENPSDIKKENQDSFTWTFYRFATIKGSVVIRWYGTSSGYYSEKVTFKKL